MEFRERLKELRTQSGISQADLAVRLGMSKSTIGMYETGAIDPSIVALKHLARFFHVDACYLLGEEREDDYDPQTMQLIGQFMQLNDEGKEKVQEYLNDLVASGRYIKSDSPGVVGA